MTEIDDFTVIGIDPGITGGIGYCHFRNGEFKRNDDDPDVMTREMPTQKNGGVVPRASLVIGTVQLSNWLGNWTRHENVHVVVERQGYRPNQSVSSTYLTGFNFGVIWALCELHFPRYRIFAALPEKWKADMALTKDKEKSRDMATAIFGEKVGFSLWPFHKDHGQAEAALMAYWRGKRIAQMLREQAEPKANVVKKRPGFFYPPRDDK